MEKTNVTLSIAIATYNEEKKLARCLSSIKDLAREIVVVDGGSTDTTVEIARRFGAKVIVTDNPAIFHINKQKALDAARGDWILQLDADEVVTPELAKEIQGIIRHSRIVGYYLPRKNFFCGHWLKKGGQYPDYVIRLIRRGHARFPSMSVHEQIAVDGLVEYLKNPLLHYSYDSIDEYWRKANSYIGLEVTEMNNLHVPKNIRGYVLYNFIKPLAIFLLLFVRHKGFMDGYIGFLFALFSSLHYPIAYRQYLRS